MNTNLKEYTQDMKSRASEKLQSAQQKVSDTARNVSRVTDEYVRGNPWKTVAVVALAACMFGFLIGTQQRRSRW